MAERAPGAQLRQLRVSPATAARRAAHCQPTDAPRLGPRGAARATTLFNFFKPTPCRAPTLVALQHDDAITGSTMSVISSVLGGKSANGCPLVGTMFTLVDGTDWGNCKDLRDQGYEIAVHAVNHKSVREREREVASEEAGRCWVAAASAGRPAAWAPRGAPATRSTSSPLPCCQPLLHLLPAAHRRGTAAA